MRLTPLKDQYTIEDVKTSVRSTIFLPFILLILGGVSFFFYRNPTPNNQEEHYSFTIILDKDGLGLPEKAKKGETVGKFLERIGIKFNNQDFLTPTEDTLLKPNMRITLTTAKEFSITTKEGERKGISTLHTVGQLLDERGVATGDYDLITPKPEKSLSNDIKISVIAVNIREDVIQNPIPFDVQETEDPKLSWRKRIVRQSGEKGIQEMRIRVISHDGKVIKKSIMDTHITKEPVPEIITQGSNVETGKKHSGLGSWYRFTGTLSAANPWLPIGSYVRVTNNGNGKSVIVRINDRGPFGKNRIIDLDAVAFQKIASLGAGIIDVKVEEITN